MSHQDWTTYVVNKQEKKGALTKERDINLARRRGENVEAVKKFMGGQNKTTKSPVPNAAKLDEDTGDYHVDRVSHSFAQALQKARLDKKLTQAQLAQQINEKVSAIPNGQIINKLNRVLGTRLPPAREHKPKKAEES